MTNTTINAVAEAARKYVNRRECFADSKDGLNAFILFGELQAAIEAYERDAVKEMTVREMENMVYNAMSNDHFSVNAEDITKALAKLGTIKIVEGK